MHGLIRWSPFDDLDQFFEGFGALESPRHFMPAVDVYETKDAVMVEMPLAGVDPDKVDISVHDDVLSVSGEMKKKTEVEDKDYLRKEIRTGSFHRTLSLPAHVKGDKASAISENGMLKISIPKAEKTKPKTVKVEVKKGK